MKYVDFSKGKVALNRTKGTRNEKRGTATKKIHGQCQLLTTGKGNHLPIAKHFTLAFRRARKAAAPPPTDTLCKRVLRNRFPFFLKCKEMSLNAKYINDVSRNRKDKIHFLCLCHFCLPGWCCAGGLVLLPAGLLP